MLLAIDVGNTSTSFGVFSDSKLTKRFEVKTSDLKGYKRYKVYSHFEVVVSSVVPLADAIIEKVFPQAVFIDANQVSKKGLTIKIKGDIGADRAVNAYAARELYGKPIIVVDFGTATTFDIISRRGEYVGGAISPGIEISADALAEKTAKLPRIKIDKPKKLIGNSTIEAMKSGIVHGYCCLVKGMITRFKQEVGGDPIVVGTGGFAKFISKYTKGIDIIDADLTLKGLCLLCQKS